MECLNEYPLLDKLVIEKRYTELLDVLIDFSKCHAPGLNWFKSKETVRKILFDRAIMSRKYQILTWYKSVSYIIEIDQLENIILDEDVDTLDEMKRLNFKFDNNFANIAAENNRISILKWIRENENIFLGIQIKKDCILTAIRNDKINIIKWLIQNNYIWKHSIADILKIGKFHYFCMIYDAGYRGTYEQNKLIGEEHPSFINRIVDIEEVDYPNCIYKAIEDINMDILMFFAEQNCHLLYREAANKLSLKQIIKLYNIKKSKYFYIQISKRKDFNLFLQKIAIKTINVIDYIT